MQIGGRNVSGLKAAAAITSTYLERRLLDGYLPLEGVDPPPSQGLPVLLPALLGLLLLVLGRGAGGLATGHSCAGEGG